MFNLTSLFPNDFHLIYNLSFRTVPTSISFLIIQIDASARTGLYYVFMSTKESLDAFTSLEWGFHLYHEHRIKGRVFVSVDGGFAINRACRHGIIK